MRSSSKTTTDYAVEKKAVRFLPLQTMSNRYEMSTGMEKSAGLGFIPAALTRVRIIISSISGQRAVQENVVEI